MMTGQSLTLFSSDRRNYLRVLCAIYKFVGTSKCDNEADCLEDLQSACQRAQDGVLLATRWRVSVRLVFAHVDIRMIGAH